MKWAVVSLGQVKTHSHPQIPAGTHRHPQSTNTLPQRFEFTTVQYILEKRPDNENPLSQRKQQSPNCRNNPQSSRTTQEQNMPSCPNALANSSVSVLSLSQRFKANSCFDPSARSGLYHISTLPGPSLSISRDICFAAPSTRPSPIVCRGRSPPSTRG